MPEPLALILDCGSTNLTVSAVDARGMPVASASRPSAPTPDPDGPEGWFLFDLDGLMRDLASASREVCATLPPGAVRAVAVTTWGADGAPMDETGALTHPVISWRCDRTKPLVDAFAEMHDPCDAFVRTGYQVISFNTLLKLIWLRRTRPETLDRASCFTMMPGLISHRLTGEATIDATAAGTTQATDLRTRGWSREMLDLAGVSESLFPRWVEPGEVIGALHPRVAEGFGLEAGLPVVAAGHDTQFAIAGSGAGAGEAVLSSGTWEILATRTASPDMSREAFESGILVELDAQPGLTNPQFLMMGSGTLEWVRDRLFAGLQGRPDAYDAMVAEARAVPPGSAGVTLLPSFVAAAGPTKRYGTGGGVLGLELDTTRGQVYRAGLEGLSFQLRQALETLRGLQTNDIAAVRVVGGGSRNQLWNQIRADVCGVPIVTIRQKETTAFGAAMFAFVGAGVFGSLDEARETAEVEAVFEPGADRERYDALYARYAALPPALKAHFTSEV